MSSDADVTLRYKATGYGVLVAGITFGVLLLLSMIGGVPSAGAVLGMMVVGCAFGAITILVGLKVGIGAGVVVQAFIQPSGASTPYEQSFSYQEAMVMRGDVAGALESYECLIAEQPGNVACRLRAAEHYARIVGNPARAAELFREVRSTAGVPTREAIYASSRLVDLYEGALADPGRAAVELRRIIDQFPGSAMARHARTALPELKARHELGH
ncbi:MAG: hypothetical protein ABJA80_01905 [bacterium]